MSYRTADGTDENRTVHDGGALEDVAPTLLELVGVEKPAAMTGQSLLEWSAARSRRATQGFVQTCDTE